MARRLALLGLTDAEIAGVFGKSEVTLNAWKRAYPEFGEALRDGKIVPDSRVAEALFKRALGYDAAGKHYPPDVVACIFWLKNRQPKLWRDQLSLDAKHSGQLDVAGLPQDVLAVMRRLAVERAKKK